MRSHGDGKFALTDFRRLGVGCVFEPGALVFHPETISIGDNVYVGHNAMLKGYYLGEMVIGDGSWIGQRAFLHSAGGIVIGRQVGIGPGVQIITSEHDHEGWFGSVMSAPLKFAGVHIGNGADIGSGAILLPGVRVGAEAIVGAGAVVTKNVESRTIVAGNPAKLLRPRV